MAKHSLTKRTMKALNMEAIGETLDLNRVDHAMTYVMALMDLGALEWEDPRDYLKASDEMFLDVASQFFLECDKRKVLGEVQ